MACRQIRSVVANSPDRAGRAAGGARCGEIQAGDGGNAKLNKLGIQQLQTHAQ